MQMPRALLAQLLTEASTAVDPSDLAVFKVMEHKNAGFKGMHALARLVRDVVAHFEALEQVPESFNSFDLCAGDAARDLIKALADLESYRSASELLGVPMSGESGYESASDDSDESDDFDDSETDSASEMDDATSYEYDPTVPARVDDYHRRDFALAPFDFFQAYVRFSKLMQTP